MNTKQYAEYLYEKYKKHTDSKWGYNPAKSCAIIAIDEQIKLVTNTMQGFLDTDIINYLSDVKQQIEKL